MDAEEVHRLADQAKALKDDPAFQAAILALRQEWFAKLRRSLTERIFWIVSTKTKRAGA